MLDPPGLNRAEWMWTTRVRPYPPRSSIPRRSSRNHARRVFWEGAFLWIFGWAADSVGEGFFWGAKGMLNLIKRCWDDESWWQLPPSVHTLVHQVMGVALNGESDVQTLNTSLLVGCLGSAGKGSWHLMSLKASFLAIIFIVEDVTDLHLLFKSWMLTVSLEDLLEFCFLGVELKIGVFKPPPPKPSIFFTIHFGVALFVGWSSATGIFLAFGILHVVVPQVYHRRRKTSNLND